MKKIYLIIASFFLLINSYATDYMVSGSYYQELNGLYIEAGTKDGYPYFVKSGGNEYSEMGIAYQWGIWAIGRHYGDGYVMDYERSYDQGAPPLTGWGGGITIVPNGPNIKYIGANGFKEMISNNGSVAGEGIFIHNMFNGEGFAGEIGDDFISKGLMTISNLNDGLQVSITKISNDSLKLVLTGQATQHNLDSNFVLNFTDNAFSGGGTLAGTGGTGSKTLSINFINALYVASSGADFTTISSAVEAAGSGDFIHISGETYTESINTNKELSFIGAGASKTIIQAHADYNTATNSIFTNYSSKMFFRDLTIKNGRLLYGNAYGGAIQANDLEMVNCVVRDNISDGNNSGGMCGGGAIRANDVKLTNCLIHNNKVVNSGNSYGGGIVCNSLIANNCIFSENSITNMSAIAWQSAGGAVCVSSNVVNKIINCTFINNSAKIGGGIYIPNPLNGTEIKNSIFYNNVGTINGGDVYRENGEEILALNSIIQNYYSQSGNAFTNTSTIIQENPLLLALSDNGGEIPSIGLQTGSPAINAGIEDAEVQNKDIRGFYKSGTRDIGAFEFGGVLLEEITLKQKACMLYVFGQDTLTTSGTYSRISGDTIYNLQLSVYQPFNSNETISNCGPYTWSATGQTYTQSGTYTALLTNAGGCDSTLILNLTIKTPTSSSDIVSHCGAYVWEVDGQNYTQSGTYTAIVPNAEGCDSTITLNLTIKNPSSYTETVSNCGAYTWAKNGMIYTQSGTYSIKLTNEVGCDSTITLNLTINELPEAVITTSTPTTVCQGTLVPLNASTGEGLSYVWRKSNTVITGANSSSYNASTTGFFVVEITNVHGCKKTSASTKVIVNAKPSPGTLSGMLTATSKIAVCPQTTTTLTPSVVGGVWTSSNNQRATVLNGVVTGVTSGSATITYTVTNAKGCSNSTSKLVNIDMTPTLPVIYGTDLKVCQSGKVFLSASIPNGTWSGTDNYLVPGSLNNGIFLQQNTIPIDNYISTVKYTIPSTNKACNSEATKAIKLRKSSQKSITISASSVDLTVNQEVTATATTSITSTGAWRSLKPTTLRVTVNPSDNKQATIKGLANGTNANILFQAKDPLTGCSNTSWLAFNVTSALSMVDANATQPSTTTGIHLYPNPSNGRFTIENTDGATSVKLVDLAGRVIATQTISIGNTAIDFSGVATGKYMVHISGDNFNEIQPIVIE